MHFVTTFTAFPLTRRRVARYVLRAGFSLSSFHHTSTVAPPLVSCVLNAAIPTIEFDKMQSFQPASSPASPHILPLKLLFAQPSMQAVQTQMEADAMDD